MFFKSLLVAGTASASCLHGVYKRAEGAAKAPRFGYEDTMGPLNWAALAPENEACSSGKNQSPINIDSSVQFATEKPAIDIPKAPVEFENLGTTIEVIVNGTTTFAGDQFALAQFHIHTPSEHRINREYFPLEVHMVHKGIADESQLVVLALMFELSTEASDPLIAGITPHLDAIQEVGSKTPIEDGIDFSGVLAQVESSNIFQYSGSLTTPPCSEGVTFLAVENPLQINVPDFNAIKKLVKYNSRLSQNKLGADNIIAVAAGSVEAASCPNNATSIAASAPTSAPTPTPAETEADAASSTICISEISGSPLPTEARITGVVQRGMRFRY